MFKKEPAILAGIGQAIIASCIFSVMATSVMFVHHLDPLVSPFLVSFMRAVVNLFLVFALAARKNEFLSLFGDKSPSLWLRGLFGGLSLMCFFYAIQSVGAGEGSFIQSTSGMFVVLLAPVFLPEKFSGKALLAVCGSLAGLYLLFDPSLGGENLLGKSAALSAGFLAGLSMIMVSKAGKENTPECVVFYLCFVSVIIHFAYFIFFPISFRAGIIVWLVMIVCGLSAGTAQHFLTKAYQNGPASLLSSVGYLTPVLNLMWGVVLFGQTTSVRALVGCCIVLFCGVLLPFLRSRK